MGLLNLIQESDLYMDKLHTIKPIISSLEARILFDGAALTTAVDVLDNNSFDNEVNYTPPANEQTSKDRNEVVFIDSGIKDYQNIVSDLDTQFDIYTINQDSDGLEQIASILQTKNNLDAIHIISHGDIGKISLGNTQLNSQNLDLASEYLDTIGESISDAGDILLYGCSVSENGNGKSFVDAIAQATGADVASSDDITGSSDLQGDWDLEYASGIVETLSLHSDSFAQILAVVPSVDGLEDIPIYDDSTDITLGAGITITGGENYASGFIDFEITAGLETTDNLVLTTTNANPNDIGEISIIAGEVFLGNGTLSPTKIGDVDGMKNGLNGEVLRINFIDKSDPDATDINYNIVPNGDFTQGADNLDGWFVSTDNVNLGNPLPDTAGLALATPTDLEVTYPSSSPGNDDGGKDTEGTKKAEVDSNGKLLLEEKSFNANDAYGVIHGPYAYSSAFSATPGMLLQFDWESNAGGDDFHIVGYIINTVTSEITIALDAWGTDMIGTNKPPGDLGFDGKGVVTVPNDGEYRFVFIAGTFDRTGGRLVGASMLIDNIRVGNPVITDAVLQKLASQIQYTNINPTLNKTVTITTNNFLSNSNDPSALTSNLDLIIDRPPVPFSLPIMNIDAKPIQNPLHGTPQHTGSIDSIQAYGDIPSLHDININSLIRTAEVSVVIDINGDINFNDTVDTIDFKLQKVNYNSGMLTLDIQDDYATSQEVYTATHSNGKTLPETFSIDAHTGKLKGMISEEMIDDEGNLNIEVSAYNDTKNETRILKIKLNVNQLLGSNVDGFDMEEISFDKQLQRESEKIDNYGEDLSMLFSRVI